jgi:hypothetical protein
MLPPNGRDAATPPDRARSRFGVPRERVGRGRRQTVAALREWTEATRLLLGDLHDDPRLRPMLLPGGPLRDMPATLGALDVLASQIRDGLRGLDALATALADGADDATTEAEAIVYARPRIHWLG